jgi:adenylate cyclase
MTAMRKYQSFSDRVAKGHSTQGGPLRGSLEFALDRSGRANSVDRIGRVAVLCCAAAEQPMTEKRKLAAILCSDVVGFSRLAGADEDRILARLRALRSDLIDPTIAVHNGRVVKRTGDGSIVEFRSVVDAVRCAIEVQNAMVERNAGVPKDRQIVFRIGVHVGDIVEESDGDLMGDGVNIAARLEGVAKPGGICLSEDAWRQLQGKVDAGFVNAGEQLLKNIALPVRVFLWMPPITGSSSGPAVRNSSSRSVRAVGKGPGAWTTAWSLNSARFVLLLLFALAAYVAFLLSSGLEPLRRFLPRDERSIAVLPFANISGEKGQDYFADGLNGDLITRLSQISGLSVVARSSMYAYRDRSVTPQEVGQKLGVRYVLEGSVQKSGDRLRINANLIEASDARQLWAEQFDEDVSNIFEVQDKVLNRIISALTLKLTDVEQKKIARAPTNNLEAYDYYLRAENEGYMNDDIRAQARAMTFFAKAIELDPKFANAQAGYALMAVQVLRYNLEFEMFPTVARKRAYDAAGRALDIDPSNSRAYVALAVLQLGDARHSDAVSSARRAVNLGPNDPVALAYLGMILAYAGEHTEAVAVIEQALRLSPSPPPLIRQLAGIVFYNARQYERAIDEMKAIKDIWPAGHENLAAAYAHSGKFDLARSEMNAIPDYVFPKPSLAFAGAWYKPYYKRAEDLSHHLEGLSGAGLPQWPLGYEGHPQDRISGQELRTLTLSRTWQGHVAVRNGENIAFFLQTDEQGRVFYRSSQTFLSGTVGFENDQLCLQFEGQLSNLRLCGPVYRSKNTGATAGSDYVYVFPLGLRYFSVKD